MANGLNANPYSPHPNGHDYEMMAIEYHDDDARDGYVNFGNASGIVIPGENVPFVTATDAMDQAVMVRPRTPVLFIEDFDSQVEEEDSNDINDEVFHGIVEEPNDSDSGLESAGSEVDHPDPLLSLNQILPNDAISESSGSFNVLSIEFNSRVKVAKSTVSPPAPPSTPSDLPVSKLSKKGKKRKASTTFGMQSFGLNCDTPSDGLHSSLSTFSNQLESSSETSGSTQKRHKDSH
jgi:hypothetical protein